MTQIFAQPLISSFIQRTPTLEKRLSLEERPLPDQYTSRSGWDSKASPLHRSHRQYEESVWRVSQPHSVPDQKRISEEDPILRAGEMYQTKVEATQNPPPREQLPPLSSLFGSSSSHQSRPAQSPYSDRSSPVFPAVSPLDSRHLVTQNHLERPYEGTYLQRPSSSRQYSYSSRPEPEGLTFQPPPRPSQSSIRPESPRYEPRFAPSDTSRRLPFLE
jgi:hypothetical protein